MALLTCKSSRVTHGGDRHFVVCLLTCDTRKISIYYKFIFWKNEFFYVLEFRRLRKILVKRGWVCLRILFDYTKVYLQTVVILKILLLVFAYTVFYVSYSEAAPFSEVWNNFLQISFK